VSEPDELQPGVQPGEVPGPILRLRLRDDLSWNEIDDQIVLLDISGSSYFSVGGAGVRLWPLLVAGTSFEALTELLVSSFALEQEQAERDVREFLGALADEGLLAPEEPIVEERYG
jgi:Coenzyme PQQ synthesis protein D (PqqD)